MLRVSFFLMLSLFTAFSSHAQTGTDYYPLAVGNKWVYKNSKTGFESSDFSLSKKSIMTVIDTETEEGTECFKVRIDIPNEKDHVIQWFEVNSEGTVSEVALELSRGHHLTEFNPPHIMLPHNTGNCGISWMVQYSPESDRRHESGIIVADTYTVESISETVSVSAGIFENCIRIKRAVPAYGDSPAFVENIYYAKNFGRVLSVQKSAKGTIRSELVEYNINGNL